MPEAVGVLLVVAVLVIIYGLLMLLVAQLAQNKGRDPVLWILLALIISPFGAMLLNALLPPSDGPGGPPWRGAGT